MTTLLRSMGAGIALLLASLTVTLAHAQESTPVPQALSPESISALVDKLSDDQVVALSELMVLLGAAADGSATSDQVGNQPIEGAGWRDWFTTFGSAIGEHTRAIPALIVGIFGSVLGILDGRGIFGSLYFLIALAATLGAGVVAERFFNRRFSGARGRVAETVSGSLPEVLKTLVMRFALEVGGLISFTVIGLIVARMLFSDSDGLAFTSTLLVLAIAIPRFVAALFRFVLAPERPEIRLVSTDNWTARYVFRNFVWVAALTGTGLFVASAMVRESIVLVDTLRFWVGLGLAGWLIIVSWRAHAGLTEIIRGGDSELTPGLERMASWWPWITMVILALNWFVIQLVASNDGAVITPGKGSLAVALLVLAPFLDTLIRGLVIHLAPPMQGEGPIAEKAYHETRLSFVRIGRVVLVLFLILVIGKLWGLNLRELAAAGLGANVAASGIGALLIIAIGYLAWELTNLFINRRLALDTPEPSQSPEGAEMGGAGKSRMATILPLVRVTLQITILTLTGLLALSQLGVNITPLLAGAGVFGLAIGFGAQTLVKDVVSGVFFLMDDAFRVGEYVDVGGTLGTVEKISIRSFQLRGARGPVHVVPYGSISKLTNMSRDWVIMKLKFTVPFDTDLEKVRKIFKKIGQQMRELPEYQEDFIEPFKSQGAADVTDVGIIIRGKFTAKPGTQFMIRKEIYRRVQEAFEENGIEFARKEVRVRIADEPEESDLSEREKEVIAAAAAEVAEPPPAPSEKSSEKP